MTNNDLEKKWAQLEKNLGYYFSRVLGRPLCPPEHVYFSLTNRCNLSCKMCSIPSAGGRIEDELSLEQCEKVIDQIAELKIEHIIFSGGEPILRQDIFDLVRYAVFKGIRMVDLISNGLLITDEMIKKLIDGGLNHITLSIDGQEEANDFVRGKGSFGRALGTIDRINRIRGERKFPTVGINFTVMDCNIDDMVPMVELAQAKKCNIIVFQPMLSDNTEMHDRGKNELWVSERNSGKLKIVISRILELKRTLRDVVIHVNEKILELIPDYFAGTLSNKDFKCYEGLTRIVIVFSGSLWTCQGIYGDLKKSSLKKHWFSKQAAAMRRKVRCCRNYCLQSCVHLEELTDVYLGADEFVSSIVDGQERKKYAGLLLKTFKRYRYLLRKEKYFGGLGRIFGRDSVLSDRDLHVEMPRISGSVERFKTMVCD